MLETERSSDEALREPTYRRLYLGALEIENSERQLKACYIILLAGRLGLRTGEIQHVREDWIDWDRREIAIPRHDPCACMNCWIRAKQKASREDEDIRDEIVDLVERRMPEDIDRDAEEVVEEMLRDDELPEKVSKEDDDDQDGKDDDRTAEEILYEERWKPKYERSARRVPFGHSRRLTAVVVTFMDQYEYLEITQVAMNNLVKEAAGNADGVNPENITIRGLRATAATHYATFIRNSKALQDLMGWTRIETAARYLRRAGAFTTDVVYHAFDKGELAPAMFPGEPEQRYPLIDNPLPYEGEPYDPMLYYKTERQQIGREMAETSPRQLIHYRAENPPSELNYDPDNHEIRSHEDYEDDIVERGGVAVFESPTMAEFYEEHERFPEAVESDNSKRRYQSKEEWEEHNMRQTELDEIVGEEGEYRSNMRLPIRQIIASYFRTVEQIGDRLSKSLRARFAKTGRWLFSSTPKRSYLMFLQAIVLFVAVVIMLISTGIINLEPLSIEFRPSVLISLTVALYTVYRLPKGESMSEIFR